MEMTLTKGREHSTPGIRKRWLLCIVLGIILLSGIIFRFDGLDARGMGHIEIFVPNIDLPMGLSNPAPRLTLWKTLTGIMWEPHPPAWYLSMWFWTKFTGTDLFTIRLPSALFGVASILLIFALGVLEEDRVTALFSAGLLAINGFHIYWSQIARPYSMACFIGLLSTIFLVFVVRGKQPKRLFLCIYLATVAFGLATAYYFWPLFATHILWVLSSNYTRKPSLLGLFRSQILILILCSPLIAVAIFQSKPSYLGSDIPRFIIEFVQFGFPFEIDPDARIQNVLPFVVGFIFLLLSFLLLALGLLAKQDWHKENGSDVPGPSMKQLTVVTVFSSAFIILAARIFHDYRPEITVQVAASSAAPFLILLFAFFAQRYSIKTSGIMAFFSDKRIIPQGPYSLISFLVIVPVLLLAGLSLFIPFFAPRQMLLFSPFLLLLLSRGAISLFRFREHWASLSLLVVVALFLVVTNYTSIVYNKNRPQSPTGYKSLSAKWIPNIERESDLIFVQHHWVTTPIFYYLRADRYLFVGRDYSEKITENPESRVWVLSFAGLPISKEIREVLKQYKPFMTITARRIRAALYIPNI
jgi:uncharacterized membrane protein